VNAADLEAARMRAFAILSREQQGQAIQRLAATGMSDHSIASATRLSVEFVRHVLGEHATVQERRA
jgi:hypothetical protein